MNMNGWLGKSKTSAKNVEVGTCTDLDDRICLGFS